MPSWQESLRTLAQDHRSPSSTLAAAASQLLQEVAAEDPELLAEVARGVVRAQPAMAALANVANVAMRATQTLGKNSVAKALATLQEGVEHDRRGAAASLYATVSVPVRVVTTSASAAVVEALVTLRRAERLLDVVCGESRPILEGTALGRWLVEQGFRVTLATDVALCEYLEPGAIFVVGTDAILPHHIVNKRGTRTYATWARLRGVPRYVLASRDKLYPPGLVSCFANPDRDAGEMLRQPPEGLVVDSRAFDCTARSVWSEIWVGGRPLAEAEARGDHAVAAALQQLGAPSGVGQQQGDAER